MQANPALRRTEMSSSPFGAEPMTMDAVINRTAALFGLGGLAAVAGWVLSPAFGMASLAAFLVAFALSMVISFKRTASVPLIVAFALVEGFAVGAVSRVFEAPYDGIVVQALLVTAAVFASMIAAYKTGLIRASERLRKVVFIGLMSVVVLSFVDIGLRLVTGSHLPLLNSPTPLGIAVSVGILVLAALQIVCDLDYIDRSIAAGADKVEAWRAAFGLVVSFVWVYLECIRLLSKIRAFIR